MVRVRDAEMPQIDPKRAETAEPEERVRELTMAEQKRLFLHLRTDLQPFVQFALMTSARLATACDLKWSDIDHDSKRILFKLKGGKQMRSPLSREVAALLSALPRSELPEHRPFVFTFEDQSRKNEPRRRIVASGGGLMEDFRAALAAAEIEDFLFHDLRHTFATRLLRQTGNLKLVSRLLGHGDVTTTTRYTHCPAPLKRPRFGVSLFAVEETDDEAITVHGRADHRDIEGAPCRAWRAGAVP